MTVVVFDARTGAIRRVVECSASMAEHQAATGEASVIVSSDTHVDDERHYIDLQDRSVAKRRTFEVSHAIRGLSVTLGSLPGGTLVRVLGEEMVADGDDEIEFDVPGTYLIELSHPHYLDDVLEVTVE